MYRALITRIASNANPRHVEAWMHSECGTLDHLSADRFVFEVKHALACMAEAGDEQSEKLALSYGL